MAKSLKDLHKKTSEGQSAGGQEFSGSDADVQKAEAVAKKYSGMNEGQLMNELVNKFVSEKNSGSFNPAELDKFYNQMSPYLSGEQRNKMRGLINMLRQK